MTPSVKIKYCPFVTTYVLTKENCPHCTMCNDIMIIFLDDCVSKAEYLKLDEHIRKSLGNKKCVCVFNGFNNAGKEIAAMNGFKWVSVHCQDKNNYSPFVKMAIRHKKPVVITTSKDKALEFDRQVKAIVKNEKAKAGGDFEASKIAYRVYDDVLDTSIKNREEYLKIESFEKWQGEMLQSKS